MRHLMILAPLAALSACMAAPPPAAAPPEVIAQTASVSLSTLPANTVARWLGTYRSGGRALTISRAGDSLFAAEGGASQALRLVGLGTFTDAVETAYLFIPADGSSGRLETISASGSRTSWSR